MSILYFKGVAHPPVAEKRGHDGEFTLAELSKLEMNGFPMFFDGDDDEQTQIGVVLGSWLGEGGELRVLCQLHNDDAINSVLNKSMRGLYISTDVVYTRGVIVERIPRGVNICEESIYEGNIVTYIRHQDG